MQMDLLNRQLETMEVIASVKTDIMQLHNQVQHHQEAHINLEGVVGHTATRVTNTETAISDIHARLSEVDRKQEEAQRALAALKAMPSLAAGAERPNFLSYLCLLPGRSASAANPSRVASAGRPDGGSVCSDA